MSINQLKLVAALIVGSALLGACFSAGDDDDDDNGKGGSGGGTSSGTGASNSGTGASNSGTGASNSGTGASNSGTGANQGTGASGSEDECNTCMSENCTEEAQVCVDSQGGNCEGFKACVNGTCGSVCPAM